MLVPAALALIYMDQHPLAVDVPDPQVADLRCPQPRAVADAECCPILQSGPGHRGQKLGDLFDAQHHRQLPRLAMELHVSLHLLAPAGDAQKKNRREMMRTLKVVAETRSFIICN